jgi:methyl coenzyme M reductase alpha subunit
MSAPDLFEWFKNAGPAAIVTFILGFLVSRFTMTKKEKRDFEQKLYENSTELMNKQNERFLEFSDVLKKYIAKDGEPTLDDFFEISTIGEKYFYQQQITAEAILSNKVDPSFRDNTLIPKIQEAIEKTLPTFYATLQAIAEKKKFPYSGKFERKNYESLYLAAERFGK